MDENMNVVNQQGPENKEQVEYSAKKEALFKLLVASAVIAVFILLGSFGYYLYTLQQVKTQTPSSTVTSTTITPSPTPSEVEVSASNNTAVIESELTATTIEDFTGDFTKLQEETQGL